MADVHEHMNGGDEASLNKLSGASRPHGLERQPSNPFVYPSLVRTPPAGPPSPSPAASAARARLNPFATPFKARANQVAATHPADVAHGNAHDLAAEEPCHAGGAAHTPYDPAGVVPEGGANSGSWWAQAPAFVPSHHRSRDPVTVALEHLATTPVQSAFGSPASVYTQPHQSMHLHPSYDPPSPISTQFAPEIVPYSPAPPPTQIFVGNLSPHTGPSTISHMFVPFGDLRKVRVVKDPETGLPRGCAIVEFEMAVEGEEQTYQRAAAAIKWLDGKEVHGRTWRVKWAKGSLGGAEMEGTEPSYDESSVGMSPARVQQPTAHGWIGSSAPEDLVPADEHERSQTPVAPHSRGHARTPQLYDWTSESPPPHRQPLAPSTYGTSPHLSSYNTHYYGSATLDPGPAPSPVLFCGNLSYETTEEALAEAFSRCGQVVRTYLPMDNDKGHSKGFGYVEFLTANEAAVALREMEGLELHGRRIRLDTAEPSTGAANVGRTAPQQPLSSGYGGVQFGGLSSYGTPQRQPLPRHLLNPYPTPPPSHMNHFAHRSGFFSSRGPANPYLLGPSAATYPNSIPLGRGQGSLAYARVSASVSSSQTFSPSHSRSGPIGIGRDAAPHLGRGDGGFSSSWQSGSPETYDPTPPTRPRPYIPPHGSHPLSPVSDSSRSDLPSVNAIDNLTQQLEDMQLRRGGAVPSQPVVRLGRQADRAGDVGSVGPLTPAQSPETQTRSFSNASPSTPVQSPVANKSRLSSYGGGEGGDASQWMTPTRRAGRFASADSDETVMGTGRGWDVAEAEKEDGESGGGWDLGEDERRVREEVGVEEGGW